MANQQPIRLGGVPEHFNLPFHLALDSGILDDLAPAWQDQPGGTGQMIDGLADGSLDLVSILTEGTVSAIAAGLDVVIVQVYVASPLQWGIYVPAASPLREVGDVVGHRFAISRFRSGSHLMAFILARDLGWALDDGSFVVAGSLAGARDSFAAGESEIFLWDRFMTRPLVDSGEFRQVGVIETPWPSFVLAVRREVLLARTAEVGRVVDAVVAEAAGLQRRPWIDALIADRYSLAVATAREWLGATAFGPREAFDPAIADTVAATLTAAGFVAPDQASAGDAGRG